MTELFWRKRGALFEERVFGRTHAKRPRHCEERSDAAIL